MDGDRTAASSDGNRRQTVPLAPTRTIFKSLPAVAVPPSAVVSTLPEAQRCPTGGTPLLPQRTIFRQQHHQQQGAVSPTLAPQPTESPAVFCSVGTAAVPSPKRTRFTNLLTSSLSPNQPSAQPQQAAATTATTVAPTRTIFPQACTQPTPHPCGSIQVAASRACIAQAATPQKRSRCDEGLQPSSLPRHDSAVPCQNSSINGDDDDGHPRKVQRLDPSLDSCGSNSSDESSTSTSCVAGSQFSPEALERFREIQSKIRPVFHWSTFEEGFVPDMNEQQQQVFKLVVRNRKNVFITGGAGTGKSVLLQHIIKALPSMATAVTASTGVAALPLHGQTIHSWAGIGTGEGSAEKLAAIVLNNRQVRQRIRKCRVLIIDEISMIRGSLFTKLEHVVRKVRCVDRPFGGMQVVLCGDFLQLPPVVKDKGGPIQLVKSEECDGSWKGLVNTTAVIDGLSEEELIPEIVEDSVESDFCFESPAWKQCNFKVRILETPFRQTGEDAFVKMLNELRIGSVSTATMNALLQHSIRPGGTFRKSSHNLRLHATCREVDSENRNQFEKLKSTIMSYRAYDEYFFGKSPQQRKQLEKAVNQDTRLQLNLQLRTGTRIMLTKNVSLAEGLVNGRVGTVRGFLPASIVKQTVRVEDIKSLRRLRCEFFPVVEFDQLATTSPASRTESFSANSAPTAPTQDRSNCRYTLVFPFKASIEHNGVILASRTQLPLVFGWATTIHKSQGMTLDRFDLHLERVFAYGQVYVALSRARRLNGITLFGFHPRTSIRVHPKAVEFYESRSWEVKQEDDGCKDGIDVNSDADGSEEGTASSPNDAPQWRGAPR